MTLLFIIAWLSFLGPLLLVAANGSATARVRELILHTAKATERCARFAPGSGGATAGDLKSLAVAEVMLPLMSAYTAPFSFRLAAGGEFA